MIEIILLVLVVLLGLSNILAWRMMYNQYSRIENLEDFCDKVAKAYIESVKEKLP